MDANGDHAPRIQPSPAKQSRYWKWLSKEYFMKALTAFLTAPPDDECAASTEAVHQHHNPGHRRHHSAMGNETIEHFPEPLLPQPHHPHHQRHPFARHSSDQEISHRSHHERNLAHINPDPLQHIRPRLVRSDSNVTSSIGEASEEGSEADQGDAEVGGGGEGGGLEEPLLVAGTGRRKRVGVRLPAASAGLSAKQKALRVELSKWVWGLVRHGVFHVYGVFRTGPVRVYMDGSVQTGNSVWSGRVGLRRERYTGKSDGLAGGARGCSVVLVPRTRAAPLAQNRSYGGGRVSGSGVGGSGSVTYAPGMVGW